MAPSIGESSFAPFGLKSASNCTATVRFTGSYNFSEKEFTPFVTGGLGWTYIDTNIPTGLPENICWAYPWYGYYCTTYVPTETTTDVHTQTARTASTSAPTSNRDPSSDWLHT